MSLSKEEKYELLTKNLAEVTGEEDIKKILEERDVNIYWGTATTGKPHFAYFLPFLKIADFLEAGANVKILLADIHGYLDNMKSDFSLLEKRCKWYEVALKGIIASLGIPTDNLTFVVGSDIELSTSYTKDVYRLSALNTVHDSQRASAEVVKQTDNPLMSNLLYPILQALDEQYLDVDIQFGGVDQRKIFMFARENLPKIGYKKRAHLMNHMIPSLTSGGKMSASDPGSKIDFDDSKKVILKKVNRAFSEDGKVDGNPLLALMRHIGFIYLHRKQKPFVIQKPEKFGGQRYEFPSADELEAAFASQEIVSGDLKPAVGSLIAEMVAPLAQVVKENRKLLESAYPDLYQKKVVNKKGVKPLQVTDLDLAVGTIIEIGKHPQADRLYLEQVDVGEATPRTIVSGLVDHYQPEDLLNKQVIVAMNLQPSELPRGSGVESAGMIMCACVEGKVSTLIVPEGSKNGDRVTYSHCEGPPDEPTISKSKLGKILKQLKTDQGGIGYHESGGKMMVGGKEITSNLLLATIS